MSLVSLLGWQLRNIDTRYNSQANVMNSNQQLMNMLRNPMQYSPEETLKREKQLTFTSLTHQTLAKCAAAQEDGVQKMLDENIKRSFSYLA